MSKKPIKAETKTKTIELGVIKKKDEQSEPFLILDKNIKEVIIRRTTFKDKKEVEEEVTLVPTDRGAFIINATKVQDYYEFKVEKGWMEEEAAEKKISGCDQHNISRILTVNVENL